VRESACAQALLLLSHPEEVVLQRGGIVFKANRLVDHSTLGWRVIKKKKREGV